MSETIVIALITASSGVLGAALGATGAILGPWWVKKTELEAERKRHDHEERRKALVDFSIKRTSALMEYYQVFSFGKNSENLIEITNSSNDAATEFYSRVSKEDYGVKEWINGFCHRAQTMKIKNVEDLGLASAFINIGFQHLISWHVGDLSIDDMKPFGLDPKGNSVWLESWCDDWPKS